MCTNRLGLTQLCQCRIGARGSILWAICYKDGVQSAGSHKKKANDQKEKGANLDPDINAMPFPLAAAKRACKEAGAEVDKAKLAVTTAGAKPFKLYCNLLSNEARQPWENWWRLEWQKLLGRMSSKIHTPRLPPKLGTLSMTVSCSTFKQCFNSTLEMLSGTISWICWKSPIRSWYIIFCPSRTAQQLPWDTPMHILQLKG